MGRQEVAIIVGAGPAGLTAAFELQKKTGIKPVVLEMSDMIGGISRTVNHNGNRIDIGGHRFFTKSEAVMNWWTNILPVLNDTPSHLTPTPAHGATAESQEHKDDDLAMMLRNRVSRIYFLRKLFDYPISLNVNTIRNLGLLRMTAIGSSYIWRSLFPIKNEKTLEDFITNRFGDKLYETFFKDYTEKVWGVPCNEISADWGAQRIKGLSIRKALFHAFKNNFLNEKSIEQKETETSLIERFLYPKFGPGQLWEEVASRIEAQGGQILMNRTVREINLKDNRVLSVSTIDPNGQKKEFSGDYFFSTMPVIDLINGMIPSAPRAVKQVANGLMYRDFITVGLLLNRLKLKNPMSHTNDLVKDNWIYIQEPEVKLGRLQIFNNWSPYMVADPQKVWMGLEYFCSEGDELWSMNDADFAAFAIKELAQIDIIEEKDALDSVVIRVPKTYPGYFGRYTEFDTIRSFTDNIENLFLIGRNGMHRYNNQDHSMLSAMTAVDNISLGIKDKSNIWEVNTEQEFHEEK
ncbi:MAG: NAD(P)/FAD-dependent oxidoreductase [Myxococcota bacterium]|nr:NAD(P)/FAD-dependent oxidoreductase [Myxococcota bacterium]